MGQSSLNNMHVCPPDSFMKRVDIIGGIVFWGLAVPIFVASMLFSNLINSQDIRFLLGLFGFFGCTLGAAFAGGQTKLYLYARWIEGEEATLWQVYRRMRDIAHETDDYSSTDGMV